MSSRVLISLGVLVACVLLISLEVSASELAETTSKEEDATSATTTEANDVNDAKYGGYGGYPGGGSGGYPGSGGYGGNPGGGHGGYPGRGDPGRGSYGGGRGGYGRPCPYGCCGSRRGYSRGGCRCCTYAGEAAETEPEEKPQN